MRANCTDESCEWAALDMSRPETAIPVAQRLVKDGNWKCRHAFRVLRVLKKKLGLL